MAAAAITEGPLFQPVPEGGAGPLSASARRTVVKKYAQRVGVDPTTYAGHCLRSRVPDQRCRGGSRNCTRRVSPASSTPNIFRQQGRQVRRQVSHDLFLFAQQVVVSLPDLG